MSYNKETGMYEGYIYCITNNVNGKQYVGQTRNTIQKRWNGHKSSANSANKESKQALHFAMNKYGIENFIIKCLDKFSCKTIDELSEILNEKEIYYIDLYNTTTPNGYNLTLGGDSGNIKDCKSVCQYNLDSVFVEKYDSLVLAADKTGLNSKAISMCCLHHLKTSGGYIWEFEGVKPRKYKRKNGQREDSRIKQYTLDGEYIQTFKNGYEVEEKIGVLKQHIYNVCNGKGKQVKNFVWRWYSDEFDKYESRRQLRYHEKNICQYDFEGNLISTYDKYTKFPDYVLNGNLVLQCCQKKILYVYGYVWLFEGDKLDLSVISDAQKPLYQFDLKGNFIKKHKNTYEASKDVEIDESSILNHLRGNSLTCGGFIWSLTNTIPKRDISRMKPSKRFKKLVKFDYEGNKQQEYYSMKEALESSTIKKGDTINNSCKGLIEYTKDGIWRYDDDPFDKYPFHKYCLCDKNNNILQSFITQREIADLLNVDFREISVYMDKNTLYKGYYLKRLDINDLKSA